MQSSGFGDTSPGFWGPGVAHPFSNTGFGAVGFPVVIELNYRLRGMWAASLLLGRTPIGMTLGYRKPASYVTIDYAVTNIALMASVTDDGVLHAALGPSLHVAQARQGGVGVGSWEAHSKLGFIGQVRLTIPRKSRFYLDVEVQYRQVGAVELGPYSVFAQSGDAVLPAMDVPFDHWLIGIGPGVRF